MCNDGTNVYENLSFQYNTQLKWRTSIQQFQKYQFFRF